MKTAMPWRSVVVVLGVASLVSVACQARPEAAATPTGPTAAGAVSVAQAAAEPTSPPPTSTPLPSSTPTAALTPTPTATATPTPTPAPQAIQLTAGGCCTQPFWSPDSRQVRFIDKPSADQSVGIYGVAVDQPLSEPRLITERIELSLAGPEYLVETNGDTTTVERLADGQRWTVPAQGRTVRISPDGNRIAWSITDSDLPPEQQVATVWVANLDGSDSRQIATLPRGSVSGWVDNDTLLISRRENLQAREQTLATLSLVDGSQRELARAERLRGQTLSPSGRWIVYYVTFSADRAQNGLWLARTDGSERRRLDPALFGAYQWRGCPDGCTAGQDRLLIIPFDPEATFHRLVELDPASGQARPLTDPTLTPFKIANGDWRVSPDGRFVVYVESSDRNLWLLELSPPLD